MTATFISKNVPPSASSWLRLVDAKENEQMTTMKMNKYYGICPLCNQEHQSKEDIKAKGGWLFCVNCHKELEELFEKDGFIWVHDYYLVFSVAKDGILGYHAGLFTFDGVLGKNDIQTAQDIVKNEHKDKIDDALLIGIHRIGIRKIVKAEEV